MIACTVKSFVGGAMHPLVLKHPGCLGPEHISSRGSARNNDSAFLIYIHTLQALMLIDEHNTCTAHDQNYLAKHRRRY